MSKLWLKSTFSTTEVISRAATIKKRLTSGLGHCIRELQIENVGKNETIRDDESASNVCAALEAIFIHGLKSKFSARVSSVFGNNADSMPEPDFWPVAMVYSHKNVLTQITQMNQITTDIGRCRAWLRLSLNDGLISSYIETIISDKATLQSYYSQYAYLRDSEEPDIMRQLLDGLTVFAFQLSCNSSCLNVWNNSPLILAGIWFPPATPQPVMPAIDVIEFFNEHEFKKRTKSTHREVLVQTVEEGDKNLETDKSVGPEMVGTSVSDEGCHVGDPPDATRENETLAENADRLATDNLSLGMMEVLSFSDLQTLGMGGDSSKVSSTDSIPDFVRSSEDRTGGNRLDGQCGGWSSDFESNQIVEEIPESSGAHQIPQSYDSLLESYKKNMSSTLVVGTPELSDFLSNMNLGQQEEKQNEPVEAPSEDSKSPSFDYEIIPRSLSISSDNADNETQELLSVIGTICPEKGLDFQNYQCHSCGCGIGMIYGKSYVCIYDGYSYCTDCHINDKYFIPARIIHNWDFKKYPVSKHTKVFLQNIEAQPLINLKLLNPLIYNAVEEMGTLQSLRTQLTFLRSYLFTCKESIVHELRKKIWPREYLYEHIHVYSLADLLQVPSGALQQTLVKLIAFAKKHVLKCQLCSLKGFICEICNSPKVIYPFDTDITYHCELCFAVYHSQCMEAKKFCPKCDRKRKREELSASLSMVD